MTPTLPNTLAAEQEAYTRPSERVAERDGRTRSCPVYRHPLAVRTRGPSRTDEELREMFGEKFVQEGECTREQGVVDRSADPLDLYCAEIVKAHGEDGLLGRREPCPTPNIGVPDCGESNSNLSLPEKGSAGADEGQNLAKFGEDVVAGGWASNLLENLNRRLTEVLAGGESNDNLNLTRAGEDEYREESPTASPAVPLPASLPAGNTSSIHRSWSPAEDAALMDIYRTGGFPAIVGHGNRSFLSLLKRIAWLASQPPDSRFSAFASAAYWRGPTWWDRAKEIQDMPMSELNWVVKDWTPELDVLLAATICTAGDWSRKWTELQLRCRGILNAEKHDEEDCKMKQIMAEQVHAIGAVRGQRQRANRSATLWNLGCAEPNLDIYKKSDRKSGKLASRLRYLNELSQILSWDNEDVTAVWEGKLTKDVKKRVYTWQFFYTKREPATAQFKAHLHMLGIYIRAARPTSLLEYCNGFRREDRLNSDVDKLTRAVRALHSLFGRIQGKMQCRLELEFFEVPPHPSREISGEALPVFYAHAKNKGQYYHANYPWIADIEDTRVRTLRVHPLVTMTLHALNDNHKWKSSYLIIGISGPVCCFCVHLVEELNKVLTKPQILYSARKDSDIPEDWLVPESLPRKTLRECAEQVTERLDDVFLDYQPFSPAFFNETPLDWLDSDEDQPPREADFAIEACDQTFYMAPFESVIFAPI